MVLEQFMKNKVSTFCEILNTLQFVWLDLSPKDDQDRAEDTNIFVVKTLTFIKNS